MSQFWIHLLMGIITLFTQLIEALAGFGATAVGLPFASLFLKTSEASTILNSNAFIITTVVMIIHFRQIIWKEYLKLVLLAAPFLPIGFYVGSSLKDYDMILKIILGVFMVAISSRYIYYFFVKKAHPATLPKPAQYLALFSGAIVQGLFTTGGPLFTLYTANRIPDKGQFRATMCACWTTLNAIVIIYRMFFAGYYTPKVVDNIIFTLPFLVVGLLLGMWVHKIVKNHTFSQIVYIILLVGGLASLYSGILAVLK